MASTSLSPLLLAEGEWGTADSLAKSLMGGRGARSGLREMAQVLTGSFAPQVRDRGEGGDLQVFFVDTNLHRALEDVDELGIGRRENEKTVGTAEPWRALVCGVERSSRQLRTAGAWSPRSRKGLQRIEEGLQQDPHT